MNQEQQELYEKLLKKVNEYCLGYAAEDVIAAIDALVESYESRSALEYLQDRYTLKKQSKPLQAFEILKQDIGRCYEDEMKIVEAALKDYENTKARLDDTQALFWKYKKAVEIFERNCLLSQYPDGTYELAFTNKIQPRDEDVKILKEVLK